jgi:nucleoid DNA-binding protein
MSEESHSPTASKPMTKADFIAALAAATGLTKKQVSALFHELGVLIGKKLTQEGADTFTIPDLLRIKVVRKPATRERKGINPFTKAEMVIKAKPERKTIKLVPLKGLKVFPKKAEAAPTTGARSEALPPPEKELKGTTLEPQEPLIPSPETENLRRWKDSGQARAWVETHQGHWDHSQWIALLEELKSSPFWPLKQEEIGVALEEVKKEMRNEGPA